jgi:hypothetical protein
MPIPGVGATYRSSDAPVAVPLLPVGASRSR